MKDLSKFPTLLKNYLPHQEQVSYGFTMAKLREITLTNLPPLISELEQSYKKNKHLYTHNNKWVGCEGVEDRLDILGESLKGVKERIERQILAAERKGVIVGDLDRMRGHLYLGHFDRRTLTTFHLLFSAEAIENRKSWIAEWQSEFDTKYKKAMNFLQSKGRWGNSISYGFSRVGNRFETSETVPLLSEYCEAMVGAAALAEGYFADPKYKLGDMVELRSARSNAFHLKIYGLDTYEVSWTIRQKLEDMQRSRRGFLTIIEVNPMVPLASRQGNKLYKVILAGETQPLFVEESLLKKIRGIKKKKKKGDK